MKNAIWKDAIKTKYDGIKNITSVVLIDNAVIGASILDETCCMYEEPDSENYICLMESAKLCDGNTCDNDGKIGFIIRFFPGYMVDNKDHDSLVFIIDGERAESEAMSKVQESHDIELSELLPSTIISGVYPDDYGVDERMVVTTLSVEEIKRIAEAKNVSLYVDSSFLIEVNGGEIQFAESDGSFQIEGIQGFMKRVYHFFVDETCYTDYCNSFYEKKRKIVEDEQKKEKQEEIEREKQEQEDYEYAIKIRNIFIVVLFLSILLLVLHYSCGWESYFWTMLLPLITGGFSILKIGRLYDWW